MTGFGAAERVWRGPTCAGAVVGVECVSLNRKQLEVVVQLPKPWSFLEPWVREQVQKKFERGRIAVAVSWTAAESRQEGTPMISRSAARAALRDLRALQEELGLEGPITLDLVLRHPACSTSETLPLDVKKIQPILGATLDEAMQKLRTMRETEGAHLARELHRQAAALHKVLEKMQRQAPKVARQYGAALRARLARWQLPAEVSADRLAAEVALCAERCDITEELARLQGHHETFVAQLRRGGAVGRPLDFLVQEMFRELNTAGAKANDATIAQLVVEGKSRLDKMREQLANLA